MNHENEHATNTPTLSVVIPVYNYPAGIRTTLESLTAQTYPVEAYEIIVVDNDSNDETREVIQEYVEQHPDLITLLIEDEIQSSYAARNRGIEHARGSLVAFIDADMTVEGTWAESVVTSHREHGWDYMGCEMVVYAEGRESFAVRYEQQISGFPIEQYLDEEQYTVTACLTVRRDLFESVGRFDARVISRGDVEFGKRVHAAGFEQYFEPDITVYHPARSTVREQLLKRVRIGRGTTQVVQYHPEKFDTRHFLDPRRYLPPDPTSIWEKIADKSSLTPTEFVGIFVIAYLCKLSISIGEFYQRIDMSYDMSHLTFH